MITPIEIRQQTFKKSLRGYDKEEVNNFLNTLSMEWEKLLDEQKKLKIEFDKTKSNLDSLKQVESVLHKTLLQAEQTSQSTVENAKKNAELKITEAESQSREILKDALDLRSKIEIQVNELVGQRNEILQQMKTFLKSQTERLETFEEKEKKELVRKEEKLPQEEKASFFDSSNEKKETSNVVNEIAEEL